MSEISTRKSTRLVTKQTMIEVNIKSKRQVQKPPLIILSDSEEDEVFISGNSKKNSLKLLDLKSPIKKIPKTPNKRKLKTVDNKEIVANSPQKLEFKEPKTPVKTREKSEDLVTPPKIRKTCSDENCENILKTPTTPSVLLERLSISCTTEKNNRRKLFQENDLYSNARKALHSTCPTTMPGREKELETLKDFIWKHISEKTSATLYISGPPGTGKTASLNLILEDTEILEKIQKVYVNCTTIKSPVKIFRRICNDLNVECDGSKERDFMEVLENFFQKSKKTTLLVLDEIDQLKSKNQSVLYTIFEWPTIPNSNLILIGIANALDLTDRILPRLHSRCGLYPQLMHFAPYTKQQIIEIFTNRLQAAGALNIFHPGALQMLAGKVASISGDVRRALDIGRRVIEMIDTEEKAADILKSVENLTDDCKSQELKTESVNLKEVMNVLNNVYGVSQNFEQDIDDTFPLQQKIVICTLLLMLKKAKNKDITIGRLHEVYRKVCLKRNIQVMDQSEFIGICSLIETRGLMKIFKKKELRMSKVSLMWDEDEVISALRDKLLLATILQDDSCLGKL